jgi:hypothetical protein
MPMPDRISDQSDSLTTLVPYSAHEHRRRALLHSERVFVSSPRLSRVACSTYGFFSAWRPQTHCHTCLTIHRSHRLQTPKLPTNGPLTSINSVMPRFLERSLSHLCEVPVFLTVVCPYGRYREYYSPLRSGTAFSSIAGPAKALFSSPYP